MRCVWLIFGVFLSAATASAQQPSTPKPEGPIHIVSYVDLFPAQADSGRSLLASQVRAQRTQQGCSSAELLQEEGRPNHFMFVEVWSTQAALDGYRASRNYLQFRTSLQPWLASPLDERRAGAVVP